MNDDLFIIAMFAVLALTVVIAIHIINKLLIRDFGYPPITLKSLWNDFKSFSSSAFQYSVKNFERLCAYFKTERKKAAQQQQYYKCVYAYHLYAPCIQMAINNLHSKHNLATIHNLSQIVCNPNVIRLKSGYWMIYRAQIISPQAGYPLHFVQRDFQNELNVICPLYGLNYRSVRIWNSINRMYYIGVKI